MRSFSMLSAMLGTFVDSGQPVPVPLAAMMASVRGESPPQRSIPGAFGRSRYSSPRPAGSKLYRKAEERKLGLRW